MAWITHPFSGWAPKLLDDPRQNEAHEVEILGNRGPWVPQNGVRSGFYPDVKDPWGFEELSLPFHCTIFQVCRIRLTVGPIVRARCSEPSDSL